MTIHQDAHDFEVHLCAENGGHRWHDHRCIYCGTTWGAIMQQAANQEAAMLNQHTVRPPSGYTG